MAELVDARDLKSREMRISYRFETGFRHHIAEWSSLVARRAHNPKVVGSNPAPATNGSVAQSVEQGTENPCVGGSIPPGGTIINAGVAQW